MKLKITHLYPDLLNLYGDMGNIETLRHRAIWRGIDAEVTAITQTSAFDLSDTDIVIIGGGGEREEKIVMDELRKNRDALYNYIENNGTVLAVCGGIDMLGKYVGYGAETVEGADILDIYTDACDTRASGNVIMESMLFDGKVVGFENRTGRTYINNLTPLGKVIVGTGNNGTDKTEGVVYKNVIGTHLHGPLLPKNPQLCDWLLEKALQKKYMEFTNLTPLCDELEDRANESIVNRFSN